MLEVSVILCAHGRRKTIATMTIQNDGTASDGSGDSPFGNYDVIAGWTYKDGRSRSAEARVEGFERRKSCWALVQHALEALAEKIRR